MPHLLRAITFAQAAGNATALTIDPRALIITADPLSRFFGTINPPLTYLVGATNASLGLVNGDTLSGALITSASVSSPVGVFAILIGTLSAGSKYQIADRGSGLDAHGVDSNPGIDPGLEAGGIATLGAGPDFAGGRSYLNNVEHQKRGAAGSCLPEAQATQLRVNGNIPFMGLVPELCRSSTLH